MQRILQMDIQKLALVFQFAEIPDYLIKIQKSSQ